MFATYANLPLGSTVPRAGEAPAGKGEPVMGVSAPVAALIVGALLRCQRFGPNN